MELEEGIMKLDRLPTMEVKDPEEKMRKAAMALSICWDDLSMRLRDAHRSEMDQGRQYGEMYNYIGHMIHDGNREQANMTYHLRNETLGDGSRHHLYHDFWQLRWFCRHAEILIYAMGKE